MSPLLAGRTVAKADSLGAFVASAGAEVPAAGSAVLLQADNTRLKLNNKTMNTINDFFIFSVSPSSSNYMLETNL
jgi:hypothetical protein